MKENFLTRIIFGIFDFCMNSLDVIALVFVLNCWTNIGTGWHYWIAVFLIPLCSGISNGYTRAKNKDN